MDKIQRKDDMIPPLQNGSLFSKSVYYPLIQNLPGPACITDSNFQILATNKKFLEIFSSKHAISQYSTIKPLFQKNHPFSGIEEEFKKIIEGNKSHSIQIIHFQSETYHEKWYKILITSIPNPEKEIILLISGCDITDECNLKTEQTRINEILKIIQDITKSDHLYDHPEEQIQQVMSRIGLITNIQYCSYMEIDGLGPYTSIQERYFWSKKKGFLIGTDINNVNQDSALSSLLQILVSHTPIVLKKPKVSGQLKYLFDKRKSESALIIPLIQGIYLYGMFLLWDREIRKWSQTEQTALMILAGVIETKLARRQVEDNLVRSEEKFQSLIDQIGDMYFMTDKSGILIRVSSSMAKNLGYPSSQSLEGTSFEELIHSPEYWPIFLSEIISGEKIKDYDIQLRTYDNRSIYSSISCRLIYDDDGLLQGIEGVIRDISRRKQYGDLLTDIEWKLEQAQKIARMGVWSYDIHLERFRVSPEIFALLGLSQEQNIVTIHDFTSRTIPQDLDKLLSFFPRAVDQGIEFDFEFRINLMEKKFRYLRIKGKPLIKKGIIHGSFGIIQDITERKDVENHLMKYATELEEKTMELDAMRTQLLDMNRDLDNRVRKRTVQIDQLLKQKDEFIQIIGHDLKTPLTPLVAILPYIRKKIDDPELCELLDNSIEDVATIRKLVTTILDLAQMNSLYMISDIQDIYISELVNQIISDNAYLIHQKSLHITNSILSEYSVKMSPVHIETIFGNLIGNAIKYSFIDGNVQISANNYQDSIEIIIKDEGIGIELEHITRIFEEFYRADNSRHERGSHGLGLAIVKRVIEMYHGTISIQSEGAGKGTTVHLLLKKHPDILLKKKPKFSESFSSNKMVKVDERAKTQGHDR